MTDERVLPWLAGYYALVTALMLASQAKQWAAQRTARLVFTSAYSRTQIVLAILAWPALLPVAFGLYLCNRWMVLFR